MKKIKKTILIVGSSGMIGSEILNFAIKSNTVNKIILLNRKPTRIKSNKITEIIHSDFSNFNKLSNKMKGVDIAYYCVGVYTGDFDKKTFKKITVDYVQAFGKEIKKSNPNMSFALLSAAGADNSEKSKIDFARFKGMAENRLIKLNFNILQIFRPGYIHPTKHRKDQNFNYKLMRLTYPIFKHIIPNGVIESRQLARFMFEKGLKSKESRTYENKEMSK